MKQVFVTNIGIVVEDVPVPLVKPKFVLVKVIRSLISTGTETSSMHKIKMNLSQRLSYNQEVLNKLNRLIKSNGIKVGFQKVKSRIIPTRKINKMSACGYSCCGVIVEIGSNDTGFTIGDYVACAGSGIASHAEYVSVPMNLVAKIPDGVTFEAAAFTTVGSISMHGLRRAETTFGDTVVILGLGLLGLIAVQIAKNCGLKVIGIDLYQNKLDIATKYGADAVFNGSDDNLINKINNFTNGVGVDAVLLYAASRNSHLINDAMKYCRRKGRVVIIGDVAMEINREDFYKKEIDLVMSTSYGAGRYDDKYEVEGIDYPIAYVKWTENRNMQEFLNLVKKRQIILEELISKSLPIDDAKQAFEYIVNNPQNAIGVLFTYESADYNKFSKKSIYSNEVNEKVTNCSPKSRLINVGFIGVGGFVQRTHLPNAKFHSNHFKIKAICDVDAGIAKCLGRQFNAKYITSDYKEVLADENIDMVIIGTQHNSHGKLVIASLNANKHTFVEKPLTIYKEDLTIIGQALKTSGSLLSVGFNRRFSILSKRIKDVIKVFDTPKHIIYRVNAGYISSSNWVQNPLVGGGRIIGEACHFIDYISFMVGLNPSNYSYAYIPKSRIQESADSFSLILSYPDGSVGTLIYTTTGSKDLSKEYIEIHTNNQSFVLKDFQSISSYPNTRINKTLKKINKGWVEELDEFAKAIKRDKAHTIDWETISATTRITLEIQDEINVQNN